MGVETFFQWVQNHFFFRILVRFHIIFLVGPGKEREAILYNSCFRKKISLHKGNFAYLYLNSHSELFQFWGQWWWKIDFYFPELGAESLYLSLPSIFPQNKNSQFINVLTLIISLKGWSMFCCHICEYV